jgi:hypothetical protein
MFHVKQIPRLIEKENHSLPEGSGGSLPQALTAQVNGLYAQIAELSKTIAEQAASAAES